MSLAPLSIGHSELVVLSYPVDQPPTTRRLSPSEREIACAAMSGKSNAEIARDRGVSPRTVANQMAAIFTKLGLSSRRDLLNYGACPDHKGRG